MAKIQEIGPYSAYAIAKKYGYQGTEEEWVKEQEANRKAAEAAAAAAAQSAKDAAASASGVAQSGQQAVQSIKDAQTAAEQAIDTAKQQAGQAAQAEAEKAATSAGQAASSAAEAAQGATNAAAEGGKVQSAGTAAVQSVKEAQNTATGAVADAQQTAAEAISQAQTEAVSAVQEAGTTQTSAVEAAVTAAVADVSNAKTGALSQISAAGTTQVSAVGTAGADAVEDVNDAKTAALEAIDAANAALPVPNVSDAGKVPTVNDAGTGYVLGEAQVDAYTKAESDARYAPIAAAIRPTASGNPAVCEDSIAWSFQGLKVYGKSTQDGAPSTESPVPIVSAGEGGSVELSVNGPQLFNANTESIANQGLSWECNDGLWHVYGTVDSAYPKVLLQNPISFVAGYYTMSVLFSKGNFSDVGGRVSIATSNLDKYFQVETGTKTEKLGNETYKILILGNVPAGTLVDVEFSVMINAGTKFLPYVPYVNPQSLTVSTPNGLPGIPVDSGGNYTDADGQRRWADVIDCGNEKKYQYINEVVVDGTNVKFTDAGSGWYWNLPKYSAPSGMSGAGATINNYFPSNTFRVNAAFAFIFTQSDLMSPYFETIEELNAFCVQKNTEGNPLTIMYVMETPIETPLSDDELTAYRALHTYDGATVVSTAEDVAGLDVKYLADGEKYVERIVSQKAPEAAAAHTMALLADGIREGVNGV